MPTKYKNNAQTCLESKVCARLQRLIVLRTIKLTSSHCFYMGRYEDNFEDAVRVVDISKKVEQADSVKIAIDYYAEGTMEII